MDAVHRLRAIQLHLARPAAKTASDETIAPAPGHELFSDDTVYTPWAPGGSVGGKVAAGWEPVKAAFAENFAKGLEKGAQLVIRIAGETVVDLHGASPSNQSLNGQPFGPDTMTNIYSSGKQIETVVMAILVDRGLVSYDDKVAQHWPAFAQGDKGNITIADVMRHEGGCPYFLAPSVTSGTAGEKQEDFVLVDTAGITGSGDGSLDKAIEQSPRVEAAGGNTRVYHAMTRGCLVDGVLRRVDPAGRSIAQFVREEITEPLGVSSTYRTEIVDPAEQQSVEISPVGFPTSLFSEYMEIGPALQGLGDLDVDPDAGTPGAGGAAQEFSGNGFGHNGVPDFMADPATGKMDGSLAETPKLMACTLTSALTHSSARAQARIYSAVFNGESDILSPAAVALALDKETTKMDSFLGHETTFTQGGLARFGWNNPAGSHEREVYGDFMGWAGWGGSVSVVDPSRKATLMYVMSAQAQGLTGDVRMLRIMDAVQACMAAAGV